jgi:membrane complex biogenesis BtpA family protein
MAAIAAEARAATRLILGINVLRNDGASALAIAQAAGAQFIRVNVFIGARVTDQGIIQGIAHRLLRLRRQLGADEVQIWADVDVKHSSPIVARPLEEEVQEAVVRGRADALIVTGKATGDAVHLEELSRVKSAAADRPVLIGSGVTPENLKTLVPVCDGLIVGTALKRNKDVEAEVDTHRAHAFGQAMNELAEGRDDQAATDTPGK